MDTLLDQGQCYRRRSRPYYDRALKALEAAHAACYKHPDNRTVLGMSRGPFSGVNEALGIVAELEIIRHKQANRIIQLEARLTKLEAEQGAPS